MARDKNERRKFELSRLKPTSKGTTRADWRSVEPDLLSRWVDKVTAMGGAILLSITSDGGAFSVTIFLENEKERFYVAKDADVNEQVREWLDALDELDQGQEK